MVQLTPRERLPEWIRMGLPKEQYPQVHDLLRQRGLVTVCREARCPNLNECWSAGTATLMLLGDTCTRRCSFCAVTTRSPQGEVDSTEPSRVAEAVRAWGLSYVVLTQVCRDDLSDQGAALMAETVRRVHASSPGTRVEVLAGDLGGDREALETLLAARPEVFAHNVETVARLSPEVRDRRASYERSLAVLQRAKEGPNAARVTKSSVMLGLGERAEEVEATLRDLRVAGVDLVTLGQYLRPGGPRFHIVARYPDPSEFEALGRFAEGLGFAGVAAGPMVRSSYRADELFHRAVSRGA